MKVLFFGDVFSRAGRDAVKAVMPRLIKDHQVDFVIVNGENMCHGNGLLPDMAQEFLDSGADVLTTGNHVWDQKQIMPYMASTTRIVRPANFPVHPAYPVAGRGFTVVESQARLGRSPGLKLGVIQLQGRIFMEAVDCPFRSGDAEVERMEKAGIQSIVIDFHAETSSEKQALANYFDGRVSAVLGTHTHVQTADERLLPGGTAAITDVGMCGCFDSVIGVRKEISIERLITKRKLKYDPAEGPGGYNAVLLDIDEKSGRARSILRLAERVVS